MVKSLGAGLEDSGGVGRRLSQESGTNFGAERLVIKPGYSIVSHLNIAQDCNT